MPPIVPNDFLWSSYSHLTVDNVMKKTVNPQGGTAINIQHVYKISQVTDQCTTKPEKHSRLRDIF